jgi:hypothetical protein
MMIGTMFRFPLKPFSVALAIALLAVAPPPDRIRAIARQAYVFAYPMVLVEQTRATQLAPFAGTPITGMGNLISVLALISPGQRTVVRPNADTLYTAGWIDVSDVPYVFHLPDTGGRYHVVQIMDAWTDTFADPGTRTTGNEATDVAIVGPAWHGTLPSGLKLYRSPTGLVWILARTSAQPNTQDLAAANAVQAAYALAPLPAYAQNQWDYHVNIQSTKGAPTTPSEVVAKMTPSEFFSDFATLLVKNPVNDNPSDAAMLRALASIGVTPGATFDATRLGLDGARALQAGVDAARADIAAYSAPAKVVNGWQWTTVGGSYGTDYLLRASIALRLLAANLPQDAIYPQTAVDASGAPLNGDHRYAIHFPAGGTPPVNAFWSLTAYDEDGYLPQNALGRYSVGSQTGVKANADGSLDIVIQHAPPQDTANWLPIPAGPFSLTLRLYWPMPSALDATYPMPPVRRLGPG